MTKFVKQSTRYDQKYLIDEGYLCRNKRRSTNKKDTGTRQNYFNIHELKAGQYVNFSVKVEAKEREKAIARIRKEVSDYSVYVGIYCKLQFFYDDYKGNLQYKITHDGIRFKDF